MLEICIQTSYDQNVQLILKSYLPVVYGTPLTYSLLRSAWSCIYVLGVLILPVSTILQVDLKLFGQCHISFFFHFNS